jgi:hypothetical protein
MSTENEQQQPQQATKADLLRLSREYPVGSSMMTNSLMQDVERGIGLEELQTTMMEHYRHRFPNSDPSHQNHPEPPPMGARADDVAGFDEPPKPIPNPRARSRH